MLQTKISLYNGVKDTTGTTATLAEILNTIKSDELSNQIYTIANQPDKKKRAALKVKLPGATFSGTFSQRKADKLTAYSGLICLDFDELTIDQISDLKKECKALYFVAAAFTSPSANGLKVICVVEGGPEKHLENFERLSLYFASNLNLVTDPSGKDTSRLCFLSWDIGAYINEAATPFKEKLLGEKKKLQTPPQTANKKKFTKEKDFNSFDSIRTFTDKIKLYEPGKRNDYINTFVCNCKGRDKSFQETLDFCKNEFYDYPDGLNAIESIVKSVYNNTAIEAGKYAKGTAAPATTAPAISPEGYNETIKFWYVTEKVDKDTGEIKQEHKFDHDGLTFFLANNGFRKLRLGEKGFQFVRLQGNLIEAIEPDEIGHFIMQYLHKNVSASQDGTYNLEDIQDELHEIRKMYKRGVNSYTKLAIYTSLPELHPTFLRDTETTAYLYFENAYVEITASGPKLIAYENLTANIWSKQRKQHEIKLLKSEEIEEAAAYKFLKYAICGTSDFENLTEEEALKLQKRLLSTFTTIGYIIDTYKDPTNTKAPVFQDRKINTSGNEANGGSGKTLTAHMIAKVINTCLIDGKSFSFDNSYPYDTFQADHKLIVYNDVNKRFQFDHLFHKITEDFTYDKRYINAVVIPHEDSPKHLVITNYSISGEGSAFRRRQQIIEFSEFFNDENTPKDLFKHRFFIDWDQAEWNRFYNLMIYCVMLFKSKGLVDFPAENVKANKLYNEAGEEFIDFMDELFIGNPEKKEPPLRDLGRNQKDELFTGFKDNVKRWSKLENTNKFTGWVKLWADMRGFTIQTDKSGRNYYWTFVSKK